jgi:hypothetical protein
MFDFPVWVFVNLRKRKEDGYPYYFMIQGGERTDIPATLSVFSTKEIAQNFAKQRGTGEPFAPKEMTRAELLEILDKIGEISQVVRDTGTPNATAFAAMDVIADLQGDDTED